jgi:hypothetical protein
MNLVACHLTMLNGVGCFTSGLLHESATSRVGYFTSRLLHELATSRVGYFTSWLLHGVYDSGKEQDADHAKDEADDRSGF